MIEPWHWFVLGIVLIVVEMATTTFSAFWFGIAAIIMAGLVWFFPHSMPEWQLQALLWIAISVIHMIIWFKIMQPWWNRQHAQTGLSSGRIIGETGMIVEVPTYNQAGIIRFRFPKFGATEWQCRSTDDNIQMGDKVIVTDVVGNELMVSSIQKNTQ